MLETSSRLAYVYNDLPRRVIRCQAVRSPDDYTPDDFEGKFDSDVHAEVMLDIMAQQFKKMVIDRRKEPVENQVPISNVNRIFSYVRGMGAYPVGRLACVNSHPESQGRQGLTIPSERTSFVFSDRIAERDGHNPAAHNATMLQLLTESVAVHELIHLAGVPDLFFFSLNWNDDGSPRAHIDADPPSTLRDYADISDPHKAIMGWYWEEGLGSMIGAAYLGRYAADAGYRAVGGNHCSSPDALHRLVIPNKYAYRPNEQMYSAWGLEMLTRINPNVWKTLVYSRQYGADWSGRVILRNQVDTLMPSLFEHIDSVRSGDLNAIVEATARIDFLARRAKVI